ncbi:MAG TPA: cyclic nucleotide-binding domain-containing protein [Labilithrix sp.]|nr:cyclic nucleotide-binding domain-containing protein [Labilithrix sp.]
MSSARIDDLREQWDRAVERDRPADAVAALTELEKLEPEEPRWSQRLGEALRRLGKTRDAEHAFVRATERYVKQGFLPRAIAMAKLVTSLNPARADLLAQLESVKAGPPPLPPPLPAAARKPVAPAPRVVPPPLPVARPVPLERARDSSADEVRFSDIDGPSSLDIVMDDFMSSIADDPSVDPSVVTLVTVDSMPPASLSTSRLPEMREPSVDRLGAMATFRLFAGLSREALLDLCDASELVEHIPDAMLMMRNEPAYALYAIIDGTVRVTVPGTPEIFLGEGDVVGEGCLLEEGERQADVRAETAVMALRIEKKKLDEVTERHAVIGDALFQLLARRLVTNLMHAAPLFSSFAAKARLELAQMFEIRRAEPGTVISERGKRSDGLYILLAGHVTATGDAGETRIARGSTFGHGSLLGAAPAQVTIEAASEAVLLRLPAAKFSSLAASFPPVLALLSETSDEQPRASLLPAD